MVTRIEVLRITRPAERASAAEDSNRDDDDNDDQLYHKERVDDVKYDIKNHVEEIQLCNNSERICLSKAADGEFCDGHSHNESSLCKSKDDTIDEGTAVEINELDTSTSNKRPLLLEDDAEANGKKKRARKRQQKFIDLTDVPPQSPIKSKRSGSSSKYEGVTFNKTTNNWRARILVDGKQYNIGLYNNEEEAAIDYARAVFKYNAGIAGGKRKQKFIDLTDVPPQSPIKSKRSGSSSKYEGVTFNKIMNNWRARILVDGKTQCNIGSYDNEEEAAIDYARAAYKYKAGIAGSKRKQKFIDLTDVPPQSPIMSNRSDSSSKYEGVTFNKTMNNWRARVSVDGKQYNIGSYDNEEEAAIDYARAAYKYKAGIAGVHFLG